MAVVLRVWGRAVVLRVRDRAGVLRVRIVSRIYGYDRNDAEITVMGGIKKKLRK